MPENWLKQDACNAVLLPSRELAVGDVLMRVRDNYSLKAGGLGGLASAATAMPEASPGQAAPEYASGLERSVEIGFGMVVLDAVFGSAISTKLGPDTDIKHAKQLELTSEDIVRDLVDPAALQAWLQDADLAGPEPVREWLGEDRLAVTTAVLKTAKLSLVAHGDDGEPIELSAEEVQALVGDEATVTGTGTQLTFEVAAPVVFGFQAARLIHADGAFGALEPWTAESELSAVGDAKVEEAA